MVCIISITTRQSICVMMQSVRLKVPIGTIGTYACGGQGSRARFSSDVDCSLKQEGIIVRMDKSNSNEFEARPTLGGG